MPDTLLSTAQAASYLSLKASTLETWRSRGGGPCFVRIGRRAIRYRLSDLDSFIERGMAKNTGELNEQ